MQDALDQLDFEAATIIGHRLRGSGGGFGYQAITDFGASIEQACEASDLHSARAKLSDLSSYLDSVEVRI